MPTIDHALLEDAWTAVDFDDQTWTAFGQSSSVAITEAGTDSPDDLEIQNVSADTVDTSGWVVAVNSAEAGQINDVHATVWNLPDSMVAGETLYRSDDPTDADHYWGENIWWSTGGNGWAMLIDGQGTVVDLVVWGYTAAEIASLNVNVNGFDVTAAGSWAGSVVPAEGEYQYSLQRSGNSDHNTASDWTFATPQTIGQQNFKDRDISDHIDQLVQGSHNVLAIHALNTSAGSSDMLILPELVAGELVVSPGGRDVYYTTDGADPRAPLCQHERDNCLLIY